MGRPLLARALNPTATPCWKASHGLKRSPITNSWGKSQVIRLDPDHHTIFRGVVGANFSHQPQLTSLDGILYATWSLGFHGEEEPGQIMVMATSEDRGRTWSRPFPVTKRIRGATRVIVSTGVRVWQGRLIAYYGQWDYRPEALDENGLLVANNHDQHLRTLTRATTSGDGGRTWSGPVTVHPRIATYLTPHPTASGRLILPGHVTFPYTDVPAGLSGWKWSGLSGLPKNFVDDTGGWDHGREARNEPVIFCEGSFFQTDDGVIHMMLRNQYPRTGASCKTGSLLGVTESHDNGETWSEPMISDYTDTICRFHFGRLPDGRFFGLSDPDPESTGRTPMVLALSEDGVRFDRHFILGDEVNRPPKQRGLGKGGRYGYPYLHLMGQDAFAIYSVAKEDIAVARFNLTDLG